MDVDLDSPNALQAPGGEQRLTGPTPKLPSDLYEQVVALDNEGVARWMAFTRDVGEARSLPVIGQLTAREAVDVSNARSARLLAPLKPVRPGDRATDLETIAVANRPGVSSLSGSGFAFETLPADSIAAEVLVSRRARFMGDKAWIPLSARDRSVGVLEMAGTQERLARKMLLYASPAALALEGGRLSAERSRREREARALADLSREIGGTLDLTAILDRTLQFAARTLSLERGILALYDEVLETTAVSRNAFYHGFGEVTSPSVSLTKESFERLVVRGQPIVLNDVRGSSRKAAEGPRALGAECFLMVPLQSRGRPLGMLYLDATKPGVDISERSVALAQAIAEQASLAIENARLYAQESRKRVSAEALREVVLALGTSLNLPVILERILEHARGLLGAGACAVYELGEDNVLSIRTALGLETRFLSELRFPENSGSIGRAVATRQPVTVYDLYDDDTERPSTVTRMLEENGFPFHAMLGLPLAARGRVFGGLALYFDTPRDFEEDDVRLMELFAANAAVALDNARLYEEEVRREREAEVLLRVARFTGETLDLNEVLTRVAVEVSGALDLERCFLGFFEGLGSRRAELGNLYAYGFDTDLESLRPFVVADEAFDRLIIDREPIVFNNLAEDESLSDQPPAALLAAQACIIAPLVAQGEVLGILYADTLREGASIDDREASLAAAIADQAALAIQNARLYEAIQSQEARYRLLAEAANDLIVSCDLDGCITYANPAVSRVLGYDTSDLIGRPFESLLEEDTAFEAQRAWREAVSGSGAGKYEGQVRRADGSLAYLEVSVNALRVDGQMVGNLAMARDLSSMRSLAEEIAERGRDLAREAARALELRSYLGLFTQAQEEERRRIARELHDDTAQTLVAIGRRLDRLSTMLETADAEQVKERVRDIRGDLDSAIDSVRRFSRNLRPSVLDDLGLLPALEWLCEQARTNTRLEVGGPPDAVTRRLTPELELTLFRVVQEALTNVDKHAGAHSAAVRVNFDPDGAIYPGDGRSGVLVTVSDDGKGFADVPAGSEDPSAPLTAESFAPLATLGHLGLAGMRERVMLAGGEMRLESAPGAGSSLHYWFPL